MIISWMLYSIAVAVLIGCAALAAERLLMLFGRATRWVWVVAFIAAVALPAARLAFPNAHLTLPAVTQNDAGLLSIANDVWRLSNQVLADTDSAEGGLESSVYSLWAASSILLLVLFSWSWWRLRRETRFCSPARVDGIPVLVSSGLGPAVVGLKIQKIVLPSWVLECESTLCKMIVRHELEHVKMGDQRLVLAVFVLVLLLPWNVALWWYSSRLRLAVEVDCDERLLKAGANLRTYSRLLLEMGTRSGSAPVAALAFSRNRSSLFRRIQHMTSKPRKRALQASIVTAVGLAAVLLACDMPLPFENAKDSQPISAELASHESGSDSVMVFIQERPEPEEPDVADYMRIRPLVYVDGVRINEPYRVFLDTLSRESIDRIEVVKGDAAREQFGERAANGVIHIYLKTDVRIREND